ncbi:hypothetical protein [Cereibacter changlensis]|uniref:hypothetical protein n=1 Tax=Cereibacter changlensis TaxID=402884 RepID=UPI001FE997F8|nr:hypothetical protein [Cereibacter changlensis]
MTIPNFSRPSSATTTTLIYGSVPVHAGPDETITALVDDDIGELKDMLRDAAEDFKVIGRVGSVPQHLASSVVRSACAVVAAIGISLETSRSRSCILAEVHRRAERPAARTCLPMIPRGISRRADDRDNGQKNGRDQDTYRY